MSHVARVCWCGSDELREFGKGYLRCDVCGTLVGQAGLTDEETRVRDDDADYYGKRYWLEHQVDELGLPDVYARVRQDLPERCVHWLKALLRYRRPPAKVLEVGAGHGAYTALLTAAGYDAVALDVSPWVAELARETFSIPYLVGPVEEQELDAGSFDVVVANDVLEHLADPVATMRRCAELLKPGGMLVLQTPEYPGGRSYAELVENDDLFLEHMGAPAKEHLYLFGRGSLELLLERIGLGHRAFEQPVFPYDMFCFASAEPLRRDDDDPAQALPAGIPGRLALALVDLHDALRASRDELQVSETDRAERLRVIELLDAALKESEDDRAARLEGMNRLTAALEQSETDRQARLEVIQQLEAALRAKVEAIAAFAAELERGRPVVTRRRVAERLDGVLRAGEQPEVDADDETQRDIVRP